MSGNINPLGFTTQGVKAMQRFKNFGISILIFALLVVPSTTSSQNPEPPPEFSPLTTLRPVGPQRPRTPSTKFVKKKKPMPNRYIVVLDDDIVPDNVPVEVRRERLAAIANRHAQRHGGTVDFIYETALKGYAIELPNEAAAIALSNSPGVRWVEEDGLGEWFQAPASPQPSPPWGLDSLDSGLPAPSPDPVTGRTNGSYNFFADGTGVLVYVLDTGINTAHQEFMTPFFSRAIQAANCFQFANCVSGQTTGFHTFQTCGSGMPNASNNDCHGHGTFVAGALGGNQFGVAKNVTIRSVKVGSTFGPVDSAVIAGMNWVTGQHLANPSLPVVANVSLGIDEPNFGVENAVTNSMNAGVTYVAAAGNENQDARVWAPQNVNNVLVVGAVDWTGTRWSLSNWGPGVDLFAPGVLIVSALTGGNLCLWNGTNNSTCILSGTSWAAPHVTGAIAMYLQGKQGQTSCGPNPIQGAAPASGNVSTCPDRVTRYILANARRDVLNSTINGTLPSPNRFLSTASITGPANPIDNHPFFFWIQYMDFLNREPDNGGLQFYLNILNGCVPSDTECIKATRGALSANFFRSPEFGGRGGYVANLFNIVIGQRPKTVAELSDPTKVERPHYAEFITDLGTLTGTDAEVDVKKGQLAAAWLGRPEVQAILPNSLSNQQFVQKLESTAGVTLANESTLIANLNNGSQTRAQVLRAVAESNEVTTKFQLQNFVTMQYIGHLRREPENCHGSPDPANCGYIFHYNRFSPGGDPHQIENLITRGFIESPEYRRRFGP
jgi:subtilisin family serine protease